MKTPLRETDEHIAMRCLIHAGKMTDDGHHVTSSVLLEAADRIAPHVTLTLAARPGSTPTEKEA